MSEIVVTPVVSRESEPVVRSADVSHSQEPLVQLDAPAKASEEPKLGRRFAELSKRERELLQRDQDLKAREEKISPIQAAVEEATKSRNPAKILLAAGFTLDDVVEFYANGGEDADEAPEKTLEQLVEEKLDARAQQDADKLRNAGFDKTIENFKETIRLTAESSDEYELVNTLGYHGMAYDLINSHHYQTGEVLSVEQALQAIEDNLTEQAKRITQAKKFQPKQSSYQTHQASYEVPEQNRQFTLSRHQATPTQVPSEKPLTREQHLERAAALLRFK